MIKDTGFTLIELAIVIVIIGLMMSAFFSAATIYIKQKRIDDMQARFSEVRLAMARYIFDDPSDAGDEVRYPCPASFTAVPGDVDFGRELCPADYAAIAAGDDLGGVFAVEGSTPGSLVLVGAIPTTTLDIRDNLMLDEFGTEGLQYGTIGTSEKYFLKWKEDESDDSRYKLDKYLLKICNKARLIELLHDFVLFDAGAKKLPRVHQYFGIKATQDHVRRREGGIIWHTQTEFAGERLVYACR